MSNMTDVSVNFITLKILIVAILQERFHIILPTVLTVIPSISLCIHIEVVTIAFQIVVQTHITSVIRHEFPWETWLGRVLPTFCNYCTSRVFSVIRRTREWLFSTQYYYKITLLIRCLDGKFASIHNIISCNIVRV